MSSSDRITRVNELLKREIATRLEQYPAGENLNALISVTAVHTSVDLRNARVLVSVFGGGKSAPATVLANLRKLRPEIQKDIARHVGFKHTPVLTFELDERMEIGDRVLSLLQEEEDVGEE